MDANEISTVRILEICELENGVNLEIISRRKHKEKITGEQEVHTFLEWAHYLPIPKCPAPPQDKTTAINHLRKEFYGLEGRGLARAGDCTFYFLFSYHATTRRVAE